MEAAEALKSPEKNTEAHRLCASADVACPQVDTKPTDKGTAPEHKCILPEPSSEDADLKTLDHQTSLNPHLSPQASAFFSNSLKIQVCRESVKPAP